MENPTKTADEIISLVESEIKKNNHDPRLAAIKIGLIFCDIAKESECDECGKLHNPLFWEKVEEKINEIPGH